MKATITLPELAEKLKGKLWEKVGKSRVYLDEGYNTKKMKTTTYVEIIDGEFVVKCFVDCPSQDYNWCSSQATIVRENVEQKLKELLADTYFYVVNTDNNIIIDDCGEPKMLDELYVGGGLYLSEQSAQGFVDYEENKSLKVFSISRAEFEKLN